VHLPNSFENSTNSKLFGCASDGAHQGVLLLINHGILRVQQAPFLLLFNLCSSIITNCYSCTHPLMVWMSMFFSCCSFWSSREFNSPWFKPLVVPHLVTPMMLLLFHCYYSSIGDPHNVLVVPLLLLIDCWPSSCFCITTYYAFLRRENKKPEGFAKQKQPAIFAMWHASQLVVHQPSLINNVP